MKKIALLSIIQATLIQNFIDPILAPGKNKINAKNISVIPKLQKIPKGCKKFRIEGVEIIALNLKNALRKSKNI